MSFVIQQQPAVFSPYDFMGLPSFPGVLSPLIQDLSSLAREYAENPMQKIPVVGIGGCPGVGKTTVTNLLMQQLTSQGIKCLVIRFDDWTNPKEIAEKEGYFNLKGVHDFFQEFAQGKEYIEKPVVNEFTDEHSREIVDLRKLDLILFEGLLALSGKEPGMNYSRYCDKGIFVDASESDITRWKRERPAATQRTDEEFEAHMEAVFAYHKDNIAPFKSNASWVISKDEAHGYHLSKNPTCSLSCSRD